MAWNRGSDMNRTELIKAVNRLDIQGGFAQALGRACLLADEENLARLVKAFPEILAPIRLIK